MSTRYAYGVNTSLTIVGPGRLGRSAAQILDTQDVSYRLVGRGESIPAAEITWLTVPDREVALAARAVPKGGVVLHASGAMDLEPLRGHRNAGSLHPLMTFPGPEFGLPQVDSIPAAISGNEVASQSATVLAEWLGFTPFEVSGDRALYHAAAVTAGNFASLLLCEAGRMLEAAGVSKEKAGSLLMPLAVASIRSAAEYGPSALTGPIARGDEDVIRAHVDALRAMDPRLAEMYATLATATRKLKP